MNALVVDCSFDHVLIMFDVPHASVDTPPALTMVWRTRGRESAERPGAWAAPLTCVLPPNNIPTWPLGLGGR